MSEHETQSVRETHLPDRVVKCHRHAVQEVLRTLQEALTPSCVHITAHCIDTQAHWHYHVRCWLHEDNIQRLNQQQKLLQPQPSLFDTLEQPVFPPRESAASISSTSSSPHPHTSRHVIHPSAKSSEWEIYIISPEDTDPLQGLFLRQYIHQAYHQARDRYARAIFLIFFTPCNFTHVLNCVYAWWKQQTRYRPSLTPHHFRWMSWVLFIPSRPDTARDEADSPTSLCKDAFYFRPDVGDRLERVVLDDYRHHILSSMQQTYAQQVSQTAESRAARARSIQRGRSRKNDSPPHVAESQASHADMDSALANTKQADDALVKRAEELGDLSDCAQQTLQLVMHYGVLSVTHLAIHLGCDPAICQKVADELTHHKILGGTISRPETLYFLTPEWDSACFLRWGHIRLARRYRWIVHYMTQFVSAHTWMLNHLLARLVDESRLFNVCEALSSKPGHMETLIVPEIHLVSLLKRKNEQSILYRPDALIQIKSNTGVFHAMVELGSWRDPESGAVSGIDNYKRYWRAKLQTHVLSSCVPTWHHVVFRNPALLLISANPARLSSRHLSSIQRIALSGGQPQQVLIAASEDILRHGWFAPVWRQVSPSAAAHAAIAPFFAPILRGIASRQ